MMEEYPEISETIASDESASESENADPSTSGEMIRLQILKDMPEPIVDESGEEVELLEGDSFNCGALMAETLIAAGGAEAAPLE